ncbi:MAG: hypothetical protein HXY23_09430, partial [Parvularculaceae bacterium]|nr:hypothetical protein [Parvularculaceae bacterium]
MGEDFTLEDALIILKRRLLFFLIPAAAVTVLGLAVVMLLPAKYTAEGSILVESAQIPTDMVKSTISSYARERIEVIKQRVMTRDKLLQVAEKFDVFPKKANLKASDRVKKMRDRLRIEPQSLDALRQQFLQDKTLWFKVSYTDPSPEKAYQVANEFMTLILSEDVRTRTANASNTTEFFAQEAARLAAEVEKLDAEIASFKERNSGSLPEYQQLNLTLLERTNDDLSTAMANLGSIDEQIRSSQTLLASVLSGAGEQGGAAQKLSELKAQLAQLRATYTEAHPEVKSLRQQIGQLESQLAPSKEFQRLDGVLRAAREDWAKAKSTLPDGDPVIAEKRAAIAAAETALSEQLSREAAAGGGGLMSSQIQAQISMLQSRRSSLELQIEEDKQKVADIRARIDKTPGVESALNALVQNRDNIYNQYKDVLAKQQNAQLSENVEESQKAEKFSILEAAQLPEKPSSPERVKLGVLALFFAFAAGAAAAAGVEFLSATVRGRAHISKIVGADPIAIIPNFRRDRDKPPGLFARRAAPAAA